MEIYLVRHGQSESNAGLTDDLDSGLTQLGREQAARTAERLRGEGLTRAYVSPLRRTLQTISFICAATGPARRGHRRSLRIFLRSLARLPDVPGAGAGRDRAPVPVRVLSARRFPASRNGGRRSRKTPRSSTPAPSVSAMPCSQRFAATTERLVLVSHADTVGRLLEAFLRVPPHPDRRSALVRQLRHLPPVLPVRPTTPASARLSSTTRPISPVW